MKKICLILSIALLLSLCVISVSAENLDAFSNIVLNGETEYYIDDDTTQDQGGSGNPIQFVQDYGCGFSSLNDIVAFNDVDFGRTGSETMFIAFSYGNDDDTRSTLKIYMDDYTDEAFLVGECSIGFTGGWTAGDAFEVALPCRVDVGVHNIFIKFTSANSGSISYIRFSNEKYDAEETAEVTYTGAPLEDSSVINIFTDELGFSFNNRIRSDVSFKDGNLVLTATETTGDPYVTLTLSRYYGMVGNTPVTADDYCYLVIKMKASPSINGRTFELFGCCDQVKYAGADSCNISAPYEATGDWEYILFDFSICPGWFGTINNIRLDWCTGCSEGDSVEIAEIRFFKEEDEANDYISDATGIGKKHEETTVRDIAETTTAAAEITTAQETTAEVTTVAELTTAADTEKSGGCNSVVTVPVALASILAIGFTAKKRKKANEQ